MLGGTTPDSSVSGSSISGSSIPGGEIARDGPPPELCVLSSSSGGNCSVISVGSGPARRAILIDAGLSPRRTRALLGEVGLGGVPIVAALVTHLDTDHWNPSWLTALPASCTVFMHRAHVSRAERQGMLYRRTEVLPSCADAECEPSPGVFVRTMLASHDDLGVAVFRLRFATGQSLGFATDLGRPSAAVAEHLSGVGVLAIESNYCPAMQAASDRPAFLKRRIMGGSGHLSNEQSAAMVARIKPTGGVVLLHLSRQCNTPEQASAVHRAHGDRVVIARHDRPTPWVRLHAGEPAFATTLF